MLLSRVCPINLVNTNNDAKCLGTEIGVLWSVITINTTADCNWTFAGVPDAVYTYPTTSAKINYPTRDGKQTSFTNYLFTNNYYPKSNGIFGMSSMYGATTYYPSTFQGFTYVLNATGLPPFWQGPFGPSTNLPANYTFNLRGTSQFEVISPVDQCTYTYQITSGSFAGMKTAACNSSQSGCTASCTAGRYKQPLQGVSGSSNYVCAFCPAGSYSKDGSSCQKCSGNAAAAQAGATTCKECPMPLVASNTATACTGCNFNGYSSLLATQGNTQNSIFTGMQATSVSKLYCSLSSPVAIKVQAGLLSTLLLFAAFRTASCVHAFIHHGSHCVTVAFLLHMQWWVCSFGFCSLLHSCSCIVCLLLVLAVLVANDQPLLMSCVTTQAPTAAATRPVLLGAWQHSTMNAFRRMEPSYVSPLLAVAPAVAMASRG